MTLHKKGEGSPIVSKHKTIEIDVFAIKTIFERFEVNVISYLSLIVYSPIFSRLSVLLPEASFTFGINNSARILELQSC